MRTRVLDSVDEAASKRPPISKPRTRCCYTRTNTPAAASTRATPCWNGARPRGLRAIDATATDSTSAGSTTSSRHCGGSSRRFRTAWNAPNSNCSSARRISRQSDEYDRGGRCDTRRGVGRLAQPQRVRSGCVQRLIDGKLDVLRKSLARTQAQAARRTDAANVKSELAALTRTDCQRVDAAAAGRQAAALRARYPKDAATIDGTLTEWLAQCVVELGEVDQDRAMSLRQQALVAFGPVPAPREAEARPVRHALSGRQGNCGGTQRILYGRPRRGAHRASSGGRGRRRRTASRSASSKSPKPISRRSARRPAVARAVERQSAGRPVSGSNSRSAYADWLSQRSGRHYRLADARRMGARRARR